MKKRLLKKNYSAAVIAMLLVLMTTFNCFAAEKKWEKNFDVSLPDLNDEKWTETLHTDFTQIKNIDELQKAKWVPSTHGFRKYEYWCDKMLDFTENGLVIHSEKKTDHHCDVCKVSNGIFTGGIETRDVFEQAFGYFEARVIVPRGTGMWSAFWLQSDGVAKIGNKGKDGSEIDIYESSFMRKNPTKTGQAIHYDAYNKPFYHCIDNVTDTGVNLYDGKEHTYALKWTPTEYVMYLDGKPVWATNAGGVSRVPSFLRLTVEIRDNVYGPYGQKIGTFENHSDGTNDFIIKEVKVYQNSDYIKEIKSENDFKDKKNVYTAAIADASVVGSCAVIAIAVALVKKSRKKAK